MTDPLMPAFCCKQPSKWNEFYSIMMEIDSDPYNYICLISSTFGICGALYLISPHIVFAYRNNWRWSTLNRGRKTIAWLAVADLLATLGIFIRSVIRLLIPMVIQRIRANTFCCYLLSFWIQYFYMVSWMWTLIYAIDIRFALKEQPAHAKIYHFVAWILPGVFTFIGLSTLYYPAADCFCATEDSFWKFFPNYIASFLPMITVMIANPILFVSASSAVRVLVTQYLSQYTNKERHIVDMIKLKFSLINLSYYTCWLPNLVNAFLIYVYWYDLPRRLIVALWYIMAIMNPLQALFNCLVYQKPEDHVMISKWNAYLVPYGEPGERTPLLVRKSGSSNGSDEPEFIL